MYRFMRARAWRGPAIFVLTLLAIEFLDEFVFGAREAAWPLIRDDLGLSYDQIGLILSLPMFIGNVIEPALGILGDIWRRRAIVLVGGIAFTAALILTSGSQGFGMFLGASILLNPASGAFVSLSQATLMDLDPTRHEQNMARWVFAGSAGVVCGALMLGALGSLGLSWRQLFLLAAGLSSVLFVVVWRSPSQGTHSSQAETRAEKPSSLRDGIANALQALRRGEVLRWLILLQFSDLMLDVLHGFLALYFVDVVGVDEAQAGLAVAVWTGVGLIGDLLLIPLLERVRGLTYLRVSVLVEMVLFPAFLLVPGVAPKLVTLGLLGLFNAGWYSILQGQLYSAMPGQSGAVLAVSNLLGLVGTVIPLGIGLIAEQIGLGAAIWLIMAGPVALLIGLPRTSRAGASTPQAMIEETAP